MTIEMSVAPEHEHQWFQDPDLERLELCAVLKCHAVRASRAWLAANPDFAEWAASWETGTS